MLRLLSNITLGMYCLAALPFAYAEPAATESLFSKTLSQEKQQNMSPKQALQRLKEGNRRFVTNTSIRRNYLAQAKIASYGQYPFAVVLNCMDSRSVPELFFDQGLADLFTLRVAGNVLNEDILGSMEFATKLMGARLIVVLGHTSCGAMVGACEGAKLGHLTKVLDKIEPLVEPSMKKLAVKNCADPKLINEIAKANVLRIVREIQSSSPILQELVANKQIGIIGGLHDIKTGQVTFFDEERSVPN